MQLQNAITMAITNTTAAPPAEPFLQTPLQANVDNTMLEQQQWPRPSDDGQLAVLVRKKRILL